VSEWLFALERGTPEKERSENVLAGLLWFEGLGEVCGVNESWKRCKR
jgi:hypothetical protein